MNLETFTDADMHDLSAHIEAEWERHIRDPEDI